MMELFYDLHIHSCLSPCGDYLMTPANIAGMAHIKGLDVVALTDHNTCRNCPPFFKYANEYGFTPIAGMELETSEEIHVLCLFPALEAALDWDSFVYEHLIKIPNRPDIFGEQVQRDMDDEPCAIEKNLLLTATDISFFDVYDLVHSYGGIMIPAHVERPANSTIATLGMVPEDSKFTCFEIKNINMLHGVRKANPYLEKCRVIVDSDAHYLEAIHEADYSINVAENTPECILKTLENAAIL